jgi:hypothetical protein
VILQGFNNSQKWEKNSKQNSQISIFSLQSVAINIEGWLKIFSSYVVYSQIWLNLPRHMTTNFFSPTSSIGVFFNKYISNRIHFRYGHFDFHFFKKRKIKIKNNLKIIFFEKIIYK